MQKKNGSVIFFSIGYGLLIFLLSACTATNPATTSKEPESETPPVALPKRETSSIAPAIERDVLYYINKHRESKGLSPLTFNAIIGTEARNHSSDMASKLVPFGHQGLATRKSHITSRIKSITAISENVAHGSLTAQQVVNLWLKSPGHRRNIEGKYKYTGIGVARDSKSELYFTQIFAN